MEQKYNRNIPHVTCFIQYYCTILLVLVESSKRRGPPNLSFHVIFVRGFYIHKRLIEKPTKLHRKLYAHRKHPWYFLFAANIPLERSDRYEGIKGTFELITVTEREPDLTVDVTNAQGGDIAIPTEASTLTEEPTPTGQSQGCRRNLAVDEQPDKECKLQRPSLDDFNGFQSGVITQKVFLVTNQRLPHGPKAV